MDLLKAIPIVLISIGGAIMVVVKTMRIAFTRDDVQYTKGPTPNEVLETRRGYPQPVRKARVYNQKYEMPNGLLEAYQGDVDGPSDESDGKDSKSKKSKEKKGKNKEKDKKGKKGDFEIVEINQETVAVASLITAVMVATVL